MAIMRLLITAAESVLWDRVAEDARAHWLYRERSLETIDGLSIAVAMSRPPVLNTKYGLATIDLHPHVITDMTKRLESVIQSPMMRLDDVVIASRLLHKLEMAIEVNI